MSDTLLIAAPFEVTVLAAFLFWQGPSERGKDKRQRWGSHTEAAPAGCCGWPNWGGIGGLLLGGYWGAGGAWEAWACCQGAPLTLGGGGGAGADGGRGGFAVGAGGGGGAYLQHHTNKVNSDQVIARRD